MGVYIGMIAALTETGICNTCIHIRGELVIVSLDINNNSYVNEQINEFL